MIVGGVVIGTLCAALGAGAVFVAQRATIVELERRNESVRVENKQLQDRAAALMLERDAARSAQAQADAGPPAAIEPTSAAEGASTASVAKSRVFAFIEKVSAGAKPSIVADYAQFLTGDAAAAAATADGEESPPPNDFYIANANPKLRSLPVKPGLRVKLVSRPDGTMDVEGYRIAFSTWAGYYASPTESNSIILRAPYWLTLRDGIVTGIEEQYIP